MPKETQSKTRKRLIAAILILCFLLLLGIILKIKGVDLLQMVKRADEPQTVNATRKGSAGSINDILSEAEQFEVLSTETEVDTETEETEDTGENFYATSHNEPLSDDTVRLSDVYAVPESTVSLKCYYPDAVSYTWQIYDMQVKGWENLIPEEMTDELYRTVSNANITAPEKQGEAIMVRCTAMLENGEEIADEATVYPISDIAGISITGDGDGGYTANCGKWLYSKSIPVRVTFSDGSSEEITGLDGLTFVDRMESSENSYTDNGNAVETVTIVNTECEYSYINAGENNLLLRYRNDGKQYETALTVTGKDLQPPEISDVHISEFDIRNVDEPVTVEVMIDAEDNDTPYPYLQYAFLPEGDKPDEGDWTTKSSFEKDITRNGVWTAYCKDQSGNMGTFEKEIIAVDEKPPVMTVSLENNDWCQSNKIIVEAKDGLSIQYSFSCTETGEESGWTDRNEYSVTKNGTWRVQARDAAGNTAEQDITINNIDTQMPVIRGITEGEYSNDETQ